MSEKSWVHHLCFNPYFEHALTKMKAHTGLGSTYALFTALNEYFYKEGYMDEKGYLFNRERYSSRPLVDEFERRLEAQDAKITLEILRKEQELKKLTSKLSNAFRNWDIMKPDSKAYFIKKAKENQDLPIAQKILGISQKEKSC